MEERGLVARMSVPSVEEFRAKVAYAYLIDVIPFENLEKTRMGE